jgi:hypothetical protein
VTAELTPDLSHSRADPAASGPQPKSDRADVRAYENSDGRWLINPQFIDPLPQSPPYPCVTQGFDEPNGGKEAATAMRRQRRPRPAGLGALTQASVSGELNQI